jgi:hypothetical protein
MIGEAVVLEIMSCLGESNYFILEYPPHMVNGQLCTLGYSTLSCYRFDPLTTTLLPGICHVPFDVIGSYRRVAEFPVQDDYEIDAGLFELSSGQRIRQLNECQDEVSREVLREDLCIKAAFNSFLNRHKAILLARKITGATPLFRSHLSDLGLDFMRQNYRSVQYQSMVSGEPIAPMHLEEMLQYTQSHRTTDADWRNAKLLNNWEW